MIVSTFWADEILLVPTWIITISILLIFIFPLESNYVILPILAPGNACVVHPLIPYINNNYINYIFYIIFLYKFTQSLRIN